MCRTTVLKSFCPVGFEDTRKQAMVSTVITCFILYSSGAFLCPSNRMLIHKLHIIDVLNCTVDLSYRMIYIRLLQYLDCDRSRAAMV